jgi:phytoene dehydrogenase-like protein
MKEIQPPRTIIIGAGIAGLACATRLYKAGHRLTIFEAADAAGGRVRTDEVDGFLLDHGFQVYLSAYPEAGKLLDLDALRLRNFRAGALIRRSGKRYRLMDVFRHPGSVFSSAIAPIGTLRDKLLVAKLRSQIKRESMSKLAAAREDTSTEQRLQEFGFSKEMIDGFFRGFYGGIFLERELRTSSRMFDFIFKMFATGHATVPALGMGEIPKQLLAALPRESVHLNRTVASISDRRVVLEGGQAQEADHIVIATDASTAAELLPGWAPANETRWRSTATIYFSAAKTPLNEATIVLDGDGRSLINNACVISDVAPHYAPPGRALVSVSVLGKPDEPDLEGAVQQELQYWFGEEASGWQHLRTYRIDKALPEQLPNATPPATRHGNIHVCGDYCTSASIEGAITSGLRAADAICQ